MAVVDLVMQILFKAQDNFTYYLSIGHFVVVIVYYYYYYYEGNKYS